MSFRKALRASALVCFGSLGSVSAFAQGPILFPPGTKFYQGVVRLDSDDGSWRCKIKCDGLANSETVVGYRFFFADSFGGLVSPGWQADGGTIVCNPFQSFNIGHYYDPSDQPVGCQVGLD